MKLRSHIYKTIRVDEIDKPISHQHTEVFGKTEIPSVPGFPVFPETYDGVTIAHTNRRLLSSCPLQS
jgi:hypothetical protein